MKSEVQEIVEELPEDADLLHDPEHMEETASLSSTATSLAESSALSPMQTGSSLGKNQKQPVGSLLRWNPCNTINFHCMSSNHRYKWD